MKKTKKNRGIQSLKNRYGLMFISPWILGIILFFVIPIFQSVIYSFSKMTVSASGILIEYNGLNNYRNILLIDPNYLNWVKESINSFLYSFPIILFLSLVIALLLNQNFRGRLFFRALYFIPVIIATSQVIKLVFATTDNNMVEAGVSDALSSNMVSIDSIAEMFDIGYKLRELINDVIAKIFDLIWSCGIQIVLFIAGLQSIPSVLYEASRVEGATKWEEFWFITFPMLSRITLLVSVFTMVEILTNARTKLVEEVYASMNGGIYDKTSAMLWFYFIIVGAIMGIFVLLYQKILVKHWDS